MTTEWTEERVEILTKLFRDGDSMAVIATAMGLTRNMVISKLSRMGLKREIVKTIAVKSTRRPRAPRLPFVAKPMMPPVNPVPVVTAPRCDPVPFLKLRRRHCRAVLDQRDRDGGVLCCGEPKAEGSSWCAFHHGLYIQPLTERTHHGQTGRHDQSV